MGAFSQAMQNERDAHWYAEYEALPCHESEAIDRAFRAAVAELRSTGIPCAMADAAESLVGALARYVIESKGGAR